MQFLLGSVRTETSQWLTSQGSVVSHWASGPQATGQVLPLAVTVTSHFGVGSKQHVSAHVPLQAKEQLHITQGRYITCIGPPFSMDETQHSLMLQRHHCAMHLHACAAQLQRSTLLINKQKVSALP